MNNTGDISYHMAVLNVSGHSTTLPARIYLFLWPSCAGVAAAAGG